MENVVKVNPDLRDRYSIVVLGICKQRKQRRTLAAHALITHFDVATAVYR